MQVNNKTEIHAVLYMYITESFRFSWISISMYSYLDETATDLNFTFCTLFIINKLTYSFSLKLSYLLLLICLFQ